MVGARRLELLTSTVSSSPFLMFRTINRLQRLAEIYRNIWKMRPTTGAVTGAEDRYLLRVEVSFVGSGDDFLYESPHDLLVANFLFADNPRRLWAL